MIRPTLPTATATVFLLVVAWYSFFWAPEAAAPGAPESTWLYEPPRRPVQALPVYPPAGRTFLGVQTATGVPDFSDAELFTRATGVQPRVYEFSQGWAVDEFDARRIDRVAARGMLPLVSWEPWDFRKESSVDRRRSDQQEYRLAKIIAGEFDGYIRSWAEGVAELGYPVGMRLAHEMNGYWYPWCEQANGNAAGEYQLMWRHVHDIFTEAGATNVIWVWSPNVSYSESSPIHELYPGDEYVDWLGVSGYYGTGGQRSYRSFSQIFDGTLRELAAISDRPVVITEVGATDAIGRRAEWISEMFRTLEDHPEIIGVIWFEAEREIDWRIGPAPDAAQAFGTGARDPRFDAPWSPYSRPLRTTMQPS
jgi:mannan endo-1,4-beta-mannosidase